MCIQYDTFSMYKEQPECGISKGIKLGKCTESMKIFKIIIGRIDYIIKCTHGQRN